MKFVFAVVLLAFAVGVQSSVYAPAVAYWGHGPAAVAVHESAPWGHAGAWGHGAWGHADAWGHGGAWAYGAGPWGAWGHGGYPGISLSQGPGHVAAPLAIAHDVHGHGHEGVYVAKTRGAIHTAPLAGHINSATSINVAPAPGTH